MNMALFDMAANFQLEPLEPANIKVSVPSHYLSIEKGLVKGERQKLMLLLWDNGEVWNPVPQAGRQWQSIG